MLHFRNMTASPLEISVQDIDHCGLVAGICDEMNLVEQINRLLGTHSQEIISAVVKSNGFERIRVCECHCICLKSFRRKSHRTPVREGITFK